MANKQTAVTDSNPIGLQVPNVKTEKLKNAEDYLLNLRAKDDEMERAVIEERERLKKEIKETEHKLQETLDLEEIETLSAKKRNAKRMLEELQTRKKPAEIDFFHSDDNAHEAITQILAEAKENEEAFQNEAARIAAAVEDAKKQLRAARLQARKYAIRRNSYHRYILDTMSLANIDPVKTQEDSPDKELRQLSKVNYFRESDFGTLDSYIDALARMDKLPDEEDNLLYSENAIISETALKKQIMNYTIDKYMKGFHGTVTLDDSNKTTLDVKREEMAERKRRGECWYNPETFEFHEAEDEKRAREIDCVSLSEAFRNGAGMYFPNSGLLITEDGKVSMSAKRRRELAEEYEKKEYERMELQKSGIKDERFMNPLEGIPVKNW